MNTIGIRSLKLRHKNNNKKNCHRVGEESFEKHNTEEIAFCFDGLEFHFRRKLLTFVLQRNQN